MTRVQALGLGRSYGDHHALADVSFELAQGAVTALVGANGSGKTTLIRRMLELTRGGGTALFDGVPYSRLARPAATVGLSLDAFHLDPRQSVAGHLAMVGACSGSPRGVQAEVLGVLGLEHVARRRIGALSLGMRQRLTLAAALLAAPSVLVLDEPANGLDPDGIQWLRAMARARAHDGCTVLLSSHQFSDIEACADRLLVLRRGRLVHDGRLDAFLRSSAGEGVLLRCTEPQRALRHLEMAGAEGATLEGDGSVRVPGRDATFVAGVALDAKVALIEVRPISTGLTEAYFDLMGRDGAREVLDAVAS